MRIRTTMQPDEVIEIQPNEYTAFERWGIILEVLEEADCWDCEDACACEDEEEAWCDEDGTLYAGSEYVYNKTGSPIETYSLEQLQEYFKASSDDESED